MLVRHQGVGVRWSEIDVNYKWDEKPGDKRQEIVFIGLKDQMSPEAIKEKLDGCLIKDYWENPEKYQALDDPFPKWYADEMAA